MVRRARGGGIRLLTCMILIAVLGIAMAVTRSWGKEEWLLLLLVVSLTAIYLALDYSDQIIK